MEQLYVFGTGHAAVTRCYNTCFAIEKDGEFFMTDAGGGNGILRVLQDMNVDMTHITISSSHTATQTIYWESSGWYVSSAQRF